MFRYLLIMCWLLVISAACAPTDAEPAASQGAETEASVAEVSEEEADHDDEHEDEHEHEEAEHDDEHEDEHEHEEADHDDEHEDEHEHDEDEHEHDEDDHDDEHREHGAHEHGTAVLTIAWSGDELAIDLETPAFNVLGFEHAPGSQDEQDLLDESVAALQTGDLLQLSPEADCSLVSADVHTDLADAEEEDGQETHSDIDVSYLVQCQNPGELQAVDAGELFSQFPNFEALQVQWVSDSNQSAAELTAEDPILSFE